MPEVRVPEEIDRARALQLRADVRAAIASGSGPLILRGSPEVFCRGVSLAGLADADDPRPYVEAVGHALADVLHAPVPTMAIVEGPAVGGGVGLLASCDRVIATSGASFAMPELLYGLVPVLIAPSVARRLDPRAFMWMALRGTSASAAEALELGLVDEIVGADALPGRVAAVTRLLARVDRVALERVRAHLVPTETLHAELERAVTATVERLNDPDVRARIAKYVHDGVPPWEGRP